MIPAAPVDAAASVATLIAVATAALAAISARRGYVVVTVCGDSMAPALRDGDRLLVRRTRRRGPRRGEIAVFAQPLGRTVDGLEWLVKRITAVPGDPTPAEVLPVVGTALVPAGHLVVRGDNPHSQDSRHFGWVRFDTLLGVVVRPLTRRPSTGAVRRTG